MVINSVTEPKRVVIASGGTGGHFYPSYALGMALKNRGYEVLFLLPQKGSLLEKVQREGLSGVELGLVGMPRKLGWGWILFLGRLLGGFKAIFFILRAYRPQTVIGMGSYLSFPAVLNAFLLRIPVVIHESNARLGLANRLSLYFAKRLALGLPSIKASEDWMVLTGTPIRVSFQNLPNRIECRKRLGLSESKKTLLIFGGSQGARGLNAMLLQAFKILSLRDISWLQCLHISGRSEFEALKKAYGMQSVVQVLDYLEEMDLAYGAADLVLSRAGASTLAEIISLKKPAILIPYPYATAQHQLANARLLESWGTALVFQEKVTAPGTLAEEIVRLLRTDPFALEQMGRTYHSMQMPACFGADDRLADVVEEVINNVG